jgi:NTE family protein
MSIFRAAPKRITLALQGGGSHGAFTWGVLDALLADERIRIEAASGASAGAINAALLAHGLAQGGHAQARETLRDFWQRLTDHAPGNGVARASDLALQTISLMTRWLAPAQWNPLDVNPLRTLLANSIDFERIRAARPLQLFIAATRVETGTLRVFHTHELTLEVLLASACLPWLHHTIEIDGDAYWDGGLTANPPLYSLVDHCDADDLVLVTMHPSRRAQAPMQADAIFARVTEIGFTAAFFAELQGVLTAQRAARRQWLPIGRATRRLRRLRVHAIDGGDLTAELPTASRMNADRALIDQLFEHGQARAREWLAEAFAHRAAPPSTVAALLYPEELEKDRADDHVGPMPVRGSD